MEAARNKRWRELNRERDLARKKAFREANKDKIRDQHKKWCEENRDHYAAYRRAWAVANPAKVRAASSKRRALKANATVTEDVDIETLGERDKWMCGLCGGHVDNTLSYPDPAFATIDHTLPLSRGGDHSYANTQIAHLRCNLAKGAR